MRTFRARSDVIAPSPRGERRGWQIGPRIRIGGTVGKIGQKLKIGTGKVLSNPFVDAGLSLIPGVGPGIAAGANAAGHVLDTSNGGIHTPGDIASIAADSAKAYALSKLAGGAKDVIGGVLSGGGNAGGAPDTGGSPAPSGTPGATPTDGGGGIPWGQIFGGIPSVVGKIGDAIGNHPGVVDGSLGALAAFNAANLAKQSTQYAKNAMDTSNQSYGERAPLRLAGVQAMLNPQPTSGPVQSAPGNPFASKPLPLSQVG